MKVRLSDYTEDWKRMFEEEAEILKTIFWGGNYLV
ncbi:hypothetical protein SAMN05192559_101878 [Halobacillus karajensis]|nr:hypothetical protein SAMN05192559_101878 [Halobacillus karajensis]